jgi:hypothetical protein
MPIEMQTRIESRVASPRVVPIADDGLQEATARHIRRRRRLRINAVAWGLGTMLVTALWVAHEWQANGAFERFAHEGSSGDWNPTLWALVVLLWGLAVGILALQVHFERPATVAEVEREAEKLRPFLGRNGTSLRCVARARLARIGRLEFHAAAWLLGMVVMLPLNALIEWQDNGSFERLSPNSQPGSWDPWMLYVGGIWALAVALFVALPAYLERRRITSGFKAT